MAESQNLTVRVPLAIRRRGGRKLVVTPDGKSTCTSTPRARIDSTLVKALARAHRWNRLLENGTYAPVSELTKAENRPRISWPSCSSRCWRPDVFTYQSRD